MNVKSNWFLEVLYSSVGSYLDELEVGHWGMTWKCIFFSLAPPPSLSFLAFIGDHFTLHCPSAILFVTWS